ncbi:hypothetical protein MATL_G00115100 [Megalops atlanticus]|uniref:Uncharacterized protein n=1 Tax=Megalops atlanticus TaxID=7932 RepID=A0A9D3PYS3_MEGAT|nr:hypothetical protein MATL_G00115100 [Megalops atlanticus]
MRGCGPQRVPRLRVLFCAQRPPGAGLLLCGLWLLAGPPHPRDAAERACHACLHLPLQHLRSPDQFKTPGTNPARPGGFPGANSPGPVADLYGTASQDSAVGNYISAASPQPGSGFSHSIAGPLIATAFTNGYH